VGQELDDVQPFIERGRGVAAAGVANVTGH
jgi:hypothetical protein